MKKSPWSLPYHRKTRNFRHRKAKGGLDVSEFHGKGLKNLNVFRVARNVADGMLFPVADTVLPLQAGPKRIDRLMALMGIPTLLAPLAGIHLPLIQR